jgi:hypothetical protein
MRKSRSLVSVASLRATDPKRRRDLTPMCTSSGRCAVMRSMTMLRVSIVDRCGGVGRSRSGAVLG